ncbi:MAG: LPS export ABC transporter permease LptF [Betaproteobacteria bacterium]|nr:LPS export ABC transporter permease LptF [Betaproteobacteria bacterium]
MIFHRALLREFTNTGVVVFAVLLMITVTTQLIRMLGWAAQGMIPPDGVLVLLSLAALRYLPILLALTVFISVLTALTRSYRDSEMVVWFTSGRSLAAWVRPVLTFCLPFVVTIAVLSLVLSPWSVRKAEVYRHQLENRDDVSAISPGVFKESRDADRVYFVEKLTADLSMVSNIFVYSKQNGRTGVMVAARGHAETAPNGDRFLVLLNGRRYEGRPGSADYRITEFGRYAVRIETKESGKFVPSISSVPSLDLVRDPTARNQAELTWRVGIPVSALILSLLAIPMSFVNPRAGRSLNLILAMLIYMVYSNLLSIFQSWVSQGRLPTWLGWTGVHGAMLVLLAFLLWRRISVRPLLARSRR